MVDAAESLSVALFSEIFMADQMARNRLSQALPKGMEMSHLLLLNHLARAGHMNIRPNSDDARSKFVAIGPSDRVAGDEAIGADKVRAVRARLVADD